MGTTNSIASDEAQIRDLIDSWAEAVRAKDIDRLMAIYAPDAVIFDLVPPLEKSVDEYRKVAEEWFSTWQGEIGYEMSELTISACDEMAFSHSLTHLTGTRTNDERNDVWLRVTVGLKKIDGEWKVSHEHVSVPFDMQNGKALLDLKP